MTSRRGRIAQADDLSTGLLITYSVVLTVLIAAALTVTDSLSVRLRPAPATPMGVAVVAAETPRPEATPIPATSTTVRPTTRPEAETESTDNRSGEPARSAPTALFTEVAAAPATVAPISTPVSILAEATCGNVPPTWRPYIVQRGDTIFGLSLTSGATTSEIVQANCLDINLLFSGTQIYLPQAPPPRAICGPPQNWAPYAVRLGDTLFSLARATGTTVYQIMQANCLVSVRIFAGRLLYLPGLLPAPSLTPTPRPTEEPATATPSPTATPSMPTATPIPSPRPTDPPPVPTDTPIPSPTSTSEPPTPTQPPPEPTPVPTDPPPQV